MSLRSSVPNLIRLYVVRREDWIGCDQGYNNKGNRVSEAVDETILRHLKSTNPYAKEICAAQVGDEELEIPTWGLDRGGGLGR